MFWQKSLMLIKAELFAQKYSKDFDHLFQMLF